MITWAGFIGKLIEFVLTKLIGMKIDLTLNQKKRTCKAFLDFYHATYRLERITGQFVKKLELVTNEKRDRLYSSWFDGMSKEIESASIDFLKSVEKVRRVINIFDPDLDLLADRVVGLKGNLIAAASIALSDLDIRFELIWNRKRNSVFSQQDITSLASIEYTRPHESLMKADLEDLFLKIKKARKDESYRLANALGMPNDLLFALIHDNIVSDKLKPDDILKINQLHDVLAEHLQVLVKARELIRKFIETRFSIEDLLYVSK